MSATRRSLIAGIALPALLSGTPATSAHAAEPQGDLELSALELSALGRELEEAQRLRDAAYDRLVEAEERAVYPLEPEALIATNWDIGNCLPKPTAHHGVRGRTWTASGIAEIRSYTYRRQDSSLARRQAEILAAYDAHEAAVRAEDEALGLPALEDAYDAASERRDNIAARIIEMPALSVAGLVVKARALVVLYGEVPEVKPGVVTSDNAFRSIVADVLAMGGVA